MVQRLFPTRYPAVFRAVQRLYERTTGTTL
jgi:hypothetical protein